MYFALAFHIGSMLESLYTMYYDVCVIRFPEDNYQWHHPFGGNFKFLSTQNMLIQTLYFLIAALNDAFGTNEALLPSDLPRLRVIRDYFFAGLAFPYAIYVTWQFWSLRLLHPGATRPNVFEFLIPKWFEHTEHTLISFLVLFEMLLFFRSYPPLDVGLSIMYTYGFCYLVWLFLVKQRTGSMIYPILEDNPPKQNAVSFAIVFIILLLIYLIGELINNGVWSYELTHLDCTDTPTSRCKYSQTECY